jgi:hypothetical protein
MSASRIDRAHGYRERADLLRSVADATFLLESRTVLTRLADDYEKMAAKIEISEAARKAQVPEKPH